MFNIIVIIIVSICVILAAAVVIRKFPQVANLDLDNLPMEREATKKEEIIRKRMEEKKREISRFWRRRLVPIKKLWAEAQLKFRVYFGKIERLIMHEKTLKKKESLSSVGGVEKKHLLSGLIKEAEETLRGGRTEKAEELFIEAIKIDKKSKEAYRGLAETYLAKGAVEEANQTFHFLLQIDPKNDYAMIKLGDLAESRGHLEEAIDFYQQAVIANDSISPRFFHLAELLLKIKQPEVALEAVSQAVDLEPKNPKYLDFLIETAIICGDKAEAEKAYNELRMVNPENNKLADFKDKITKL